MQRQGNSGSVHAGPPFRDLNVGDPCLVQPSLDFVFRIEADLGPSLVVGNVGVGVREVIPILGGRFAGVGLSGEVLPGGADWCLVRPDGSCEIWARYTLRTDAGMLVAVTNPGEAAPDANGNFVGRTSPRFEVGDGPHAWLRATTFVGTLFTRADGTRATIEVFRVL